MIPRQNFYMRPIMQVLGAGMQPMTGWRLDRRSPRTTPDFTV